MTVRIGLLDPVFGEELILVQIIYAVCNIDAAELLISLAGRSLEVARNMHFVSVGVSIRVVSVFNVPDDRLGDGVLRILL